MRQWNTPSANRVSERVFLPLFDHKSGVSVPVGAWRCQLFMSFAVWILDQLRSRHRSPKGLRAPALFPSKENSLPHLNGANDSYSDARTPPCIGRWDIKGTEKMGKREGINPYSKIWFRTRRRKWLLYIHFFLSLWNDLSVPSTVALTCCPGGCLPLRLFPQPTHCLTQGKFLSKSMLRSGVTSWWNRNHPLLPVVVLGWVFPETRIRGPQVYLGSESRKHQWRKRKVRQGREAVSKEVLSSAHLGN